MQEEARNGAGKAEIWSIALNGRFKENSASELVLLSGGVKRITLTSALNMLSRGVQPALVVIDTYPDQSGENALADLKRANPQVPVVFLRPRETAHEMHAWFDRRMLQALQPDRPPARETYNTCGLSERELEVLRLLVQGLITKEIAEVLSISYHTVDQHQRRVFKKLNVHTRSAAVAKALMEKIC